MHGDMGGWDWSMMVVMPLLWLGPTVLIAWVIWAAWSRSTRATPLDLLKGSYVSGHITRDQFEQMKKDLV